MKINATFHAWISLLYPLSPLYTKACFFTARALSFVLDPPPSRAGLVGLSAAAVGANGTLVATVKVQNTGARTGGKVVQLMLREKAVRMPRRANRWLCAFSKVHDLEAGASLQLELRIGAESWSSYDAFTHDFVARPGVYEVFVLQNSQHVEPREFEVRVLAPAAAPAAAAAEVPGGRARGAAPAASRELPAPAPTAVRVDVACGNASSPPLVRKLQAYNSGLVSMARTRRDAHLLPLSGASKLRLDVGLGWGGAARPAFPAEFMSWSVRRALLTP